MRYHEILGESETFINELGNTITVDVTTLPIDGVDGINIHIEGPTSETDNHVTRMEAETIFRHLAAELDRDELDEEILNEHYVNCFTPEEKQEYAERVFELIQIAYANIGGNCNITDIEALCEDTGMWKLVRRNGEIIFAAIYKDRQGRKFVAIGHDGSREGKSELRSIIAQEVRMHRCWAEVSGSMAKIMLNSGMSAIPADRASEVLGKDILAYGDDGYSYTRIIGGNTYNKVLVGYPNGEEMGTTPDTEEIANILNYVAHDE